MDVIRSVLATALLLCSTQALALFMPEGFTISTESSVPTDSGCGNISLVSDPTRH